MAEHEIATLAGGCFWCLEAVFCDLRGVSKVQSGFMGGHVENPSYEEVCRETTGHAEVVQVTFDPQEISFDTLLDVFFTIHDPTQLNRQGHDVGTQYRSAVFTHSPQQAAMLDAAFARAADIWDGEIVTEVLEAAQFWPAEKYHDDYFANNPNQPYCLGVVAPKVQKARQKFRDLQRDKS